MCSARAWHAKSSRKVAVRCHVALNHVRQVIIVHFRVKNVFLINPILVLQMGIIDAVDPQLVAGFIHFVIGVFARQMFRGLIHVACPAEAVTPYAVAVFVEGQAAVRAYAIFKLRCAVRALFDTVSHISNRAQSQDSSAEHALEKTACATIFIVFVSLNIFCVFLLLLEVLAEGIASGNKIWMLDEGHCD